MRHPGQGQEERLAEICRRRRHARAGPGEIRCPRRGAQGQVRLRCRQGARGRGQLDATGRKYHRRGLNRTLVDLRVLLVEQLDSYRCLEKRCCSLNLFDSNACKRVRPNDRDASSSPFAVVRPSTPAKPVLSSLSPRTAPLPPTASRSARNAAEAGRTAREARLRVPRPRRRHP